MVLLIMSHVDGFLSSSIITLPAVSDIQLLEEITTHNHIVHIDILWRETGLKGGISRIQVVLRIPQKLKMISMKLSE